MIQIAGSFPFVCRVAAKATAQVPVPHERVSPEPLSKTRI